MALIPRKRMSSDLLDPEPREGSFNGVTSDGVFKGTGKAIDNLLDDGSASETVTVEVPSSQSSDYTVGNYYEVQGKIAKLSGKTEGDDTTELTFDTTSGVLDAMNDIVANIASIGSPLVWKGPATVAQLNAGITGIQPGWTYTLTDAGTLTDGNVAVEKDDEVAWTEDGEWFKIGGDSGKVEVFQVTYDTDHYVWPSFNDIDAVVTNGKSACLVQTNPAGAKTLYWLTFRSTASANLYFRFTTGSSNYVDIYQDGSVASGNLLVRTAAIAPDYDPTHTYPTVGTAVMYGGKRYVSNTAIATAEDWTPAHWTEKSVEDEIGNVETLLAAL